MEELRHLDHVEWRTSTLCQNATCVEVAFSQNLVAVRSSKDRSGPVVAFDAEEWRAFVGGVRQGEFDLPAKKIS
jgi:hypothetical protein